MAKQDSVRWLGTVEFKEHFLWVNLPWISSLLRMTSGQYVLCPVLFLILWPPSDFLRSTLSPILFLILWPDLTSFMKILKNSPLLQPPHPPAPPSLHKNWISVSQCFAFLSQTNVMWWVTMYLLQILCYEFPMMIWQGRCWLLIFITLLVFSHSKADALGYSFGYSFGGGDG